MALGVMGLVEMYWAKSRPTYLIIIFIGLNRGLDPLLPKWSFYSRLAFHLQKNYVKKPDCTDYEVKFFHCFTFFDLLSSAAISSRSSWKYRKNITHVSYVHEVT